MSTFEPARPSRPGLATAAIACGLVGLACSAVLFTWSMVSMFSPEETITSQADLVAFTLVSWLVQLVSVGLGAMAVVFGLVSGSQARRSGLGYPVAAKVGLVSGIITIVLIAVVFIIGFAGALMSFEQAEEFFRRRRAL